MNSQQIKNAFAEQGIKVRVKDLKIKFRICTIDESPHTEQSIQIVKMLGLTDVLGNGGGEISQEHELIAYKECVIQSLVG